jgi:IS30 family transposase
LASITNKRLSVSSNVGLDWIIYKVERLTVQAVGQAVVRLHKPYRNKVHTITWGNRREFAGHEAVAKRL